MIFRVFRKGVPAGSLRENSSKSSKQRGTMRTQCKDAPFMGKSWLSGALPPSHVAWALAFDFGWVLHYFLLFFAFGFLS